MLTTFLRHAAVACVRSRWSPFPHALLAVLVLAGVLAPGPAARARGDDGPGASEAVEAGRIVRLRLRGPVYEGPPPVQLFGGRGGASLRRITEAVRKVRDDPEAAGLLLELENPVLGWTQLQALRRELLRFRESGKPSWCFIESGDWDFGLPTYLLASACSKVSLLPAGHLQIPGVALHKVYLKDLFDKLGIRFEDLRMGRYKSAAEAFTRSEPSQAEREQTQAILDDIYAEYVDTLAANRDLDALAVRSLVDRALFSPREALDAGLVDHVEYRDEFLDRVRRGPGDAVREVVDARLGRRLRIQGGGMAGLMAIFNQIFSGPSRGTASERPKIAIVHGAGAVVRGRGMGSIFGGSVMAADRLRELFRKVREDDSVQAVVFRVDSPGGSAVASEVIWRAVTKTAEAKPVVVSMGDLAASGGYYVSCGATWIVAERGTLTGSIGVIGMTADLRRLYDWIGVRFESFTRGERRDAMSPYGELSDEGREMLRRHMERIYETFIARVADGRDMAEDAVESVAAGRIWTGLRAEELGLVDSLGGLDTALAKARELAELPEDIEVIPLPRPKGLFEILQGLDAEGSTLRAVAARLPSPLASLLERLEWLQAASRERLMLVHPALLRITAR